jgi:hypothetical protein
LDEEPAITREEAAYLMDSLRFFFSDPLLSLDLCVPTFAGIRPVLSGGKLSPSKESHEHVVWLNKGRVPGLRRDDIRRPVPAPDFDPGFAGDSMAIGRLSKYPTTQPIDII